MKTPVMVNIAAYTLRDQMRHKSLYVLLGLGMFLVLMMRGCYQAEYSVNGRPVDHLLVVWQVAKLVFQVIASGMFFMVVVMAMKMFSRDQEDGSLVLFLSRPVGRWQYVVGRVAGTWAVSFIFMFMLHLTLLLTVWTSSGAFMGRLLAASLVCSVNLLLIIVLVGFFSLCMPDFIGAVLTMGILLVGYISDGGHLMMHSRIMPSAIPGALDSGPAVWRIVYPKVFMVQAYADALISNSKFVHMGPLHPLLNVAAFILLTATFLLIAFYRKAV